MKFYTNNQFEVMAGIRSGAIYLLFELIHEEGPIRLSTMPVNWIDKFGRTWIGGGSFLSFGEDFTKSGLQGGQCTIVWNGASQTLIGVARSTGILGAVIRRYFVLIDDNGAEIGDPVLTFNGICQTPEINSDPSSPTITLVAESRVLKLNRTRDFRYTPEHQKRYFPEDTGFDFVAGLQDANYDW